MSKALGVKRHLHVPHKHSPWHRPIACAGVRQAESWWVRNRMQKWGKGQGGPANLGIIIPQLRDESPGHTLRALQSRPRGGHVAAGRGTPAVVNPVSQVRQDGHGVHSYVQTRLGTRGSRPRLLTAAPAAHPASTSAGTGAPPAKMTGNPGSQAHLWSLCRSVLLYTDSSSSCHAAPADGGVAGP